MSPAQRRWLDMAWVISLLMILVLAAKYLTGERSQSGPDSQLPGGPTKASSSRDPLGKEIDLLRMLDPVMDTVSGSWRVAKNQLVCSRSPEARIQLPFAPPDEYDLKIVVERRSSDNVSFHVGLVGNRRQFLATIDGFGIPRTAIELIDGAASEMKGTHHDIQLLKWRKRSTIVCSVRRSRLKIDVDGRTAIDWEADFGRVSLPPQWRVREDQVIFLGTWNSEFFIYEIVLTEVSGQGKPLR
jgi:hypothetical protein